MKRWLAPCLSACVLFVGCRGPEMEASADAEARAAARRTAAEAPAAAQRTEANKEVVRRFVAAVNERDFGALDELVAPDVVRHSPSTPGVTVRNREELVAFLRQDLAGVPDAVQEIRLMVAEDDWVAVWANYSGTQDGPLGPFPATGKPVDLDFAGFLRLEEGRIAEIRAVWDNLSMLAALGHLPAPGADGS